MSFTYYLLQIPTFWLFILIISIGAIISGLGTIFFRKYVNVKILRSHNEVTGFLFLAIASFYAFLLSFIVFMVWGQLNETRGNVSKEGSSAMGLYRDIKFYPDTVESKQLMIVYLDFIYNVIDEEFPNMEQRKPSRKTTESFNHVFYKMEHLNPKNQFQIQLVAEMFNHLNELATYRGLRETSLEKEIPSPLWWPMILGALITIFCSILLDIEHTRMHVSLNALLGIFIGMIFFIILLLDHPYSGSLSIKPQSYKQIFTMEQWANEPQVEKPIQVK
jgi:ABC-type multidrug transport system fused ATPase/permease subunit